MVEEFVLIPKDHYAQDHPTVKQVLSDPTIKAKSTQLSYLQRLEGPSIQDEIPAKLPKLEEEEEIEIDVKIDREALFRDIPSFKKEQVLKSNVILDRVESSQRVSISADKTIIIDGQDSRRHLSTFLYNLQQPRKILNKTELEILRAIEILPQHFTNSSGKRFLTKFDQSSDSDSVHTAQDTHEDAKKQSGSGRKWITFKR